MNYLILTGWWQMNRTERIARLLFARLNTDPRITADNSYYVQNASFQTEVKSDPVARVPIQYGWQRYEQLAQEIVDLEA